MNIKGSVVLFTGTNRGIALAFTRALLARSARKVYAGARAPSGITEPDLESLKLDVSSVEDVTAATALASDVTLVINNAGIAQPRQL